MLGRLRHWAGAGAVFTGLVCGVWAAPGYLPAVGPAALRFRPAAPSGTNLMRMPLPPPDVPASSPSTSSTNTAADTEAKPAPAAGTPSSAPLIFAATNTPSQPEASSLRIRAFDFSADAPQVFQPVNQRREQRDYRAGGFRAAAAAAPAFQHGDLFDGALIDQSPHETPNQGLKGPKGPKC